MENNLFEEKWHGDKINSIAQTVAFIKKAPAILKKYKFEKILPDIISKLLKSNDKLWLDVEEGTRMSRRQKIVIPNIEEKVDDIVNKVVTERLKDSPNQNLIEFFLEEIEYIKKNFEPETNILTTYTELNKNYTDIELVSFFVEVAEKLDVLIEGTMDKDGLFSKEDLFVEYFAKLFAYTINNCNIEITGTNIKIQFVADEVNEEELNELNNN